MTWITDDASISDSAPADLFTFTGPSTVYRYTSAERDIVYAANTYTALAGLTRGTLGNTTAVDPPELIVDIPVTAQVVKDFGFGRPPRSLSFTLHTLQAVSGAALERWRGNVTGFAHLGRKSRCRIPLFIGDPMDAMIGSAAFQSTCGHGWAEGLCPVNRNDFDYASTVATIVGDGSTITVASIVGNPDDYFTAGEIRRDTDGEKRYILSQIGTTLILDEPFRTLAIGNAVTFWAGCDRLVQTCHTKFNAINGVAGGGFGGHPYIGETNPFLSRWSRFFV